jgi:hypothetical protein
MRKSNFTGMRWPVILLILIVVSMTLSIPALARGGSQPLADPWVTSVADPLKGGSSLSIAIDANNRPHASYFGFKNANDTSPFGLKYARWNGTKWIIEYIEDVGRTVAETSIALDSQGRPHISYYSLPTRHLKYAYFDGTKWNIEEVDTGLDVGITNSLRLDSNDLPRIAYWDEAQQRVRYARFDGNAWIFSTVEDLDCVSPLPKRVSLALDSNDLPHVTYHNCAAQTALIYASRVSGEWIFELVESGINSGLSNSLEVDDQDKPHISYRSGNTVGGLMYAYFNGTNWQFSLRVDNDFWYGNSTSLALDSSRRPRIAYTFWPPRDEPIAREFRFAIINGDQRSYEVIDVADPTSQDAQIALAIDGNANYHVVYWDNVTNTLKYARRGPLSQPIIDQGVLLPLILRKY